MYALFQLRTAKKRASQSMASEEILKTQGALKKEQSVEKDEDDGTQFSIKNFLFKIRLAIKGYKFLPLVP